MILFRLVKSGYGSFEQVREFDARVVLQALNYEKFLNDYENATLEAVK